MTARKTLRARIRDALVDLAAQEIEEPHTTRLRTMIDLDAAADIAAGVAIEAIREAVADTWRETIPD